MIIKGANKQIVEINKTDSAYFDRILLFVNPEIGTDDEEKLKKEANRVVKSYLISSAPQKVQNAKWIKKSKINWIRLIAAACFGAMVACLIMKF